jgi:hypothetical protein
MAERPSRFSGLDGMAAAVAASPVLIFGAAILCRYAQIVRGLLELLSFAATAVLAITAIAAISFARAQAEEARKGREEAENNRLTGIYMTIAARWNAEDLFQSRLKVLALRDAARQQWEQDGHDPRDEARTAFERGFIRDALLRLKNDYKREELRKYTFILQFLEDVGTLCRNQYIRQNDVFDLIGGPIQVQVECLELYIEEARKPAFGDSDTVYANTIYLYRQARMARSARYSEPEWPLKR